MSEAMEKYEFFTDKMIYSKKWKTFETDNLFRWLHQHFSENMFVWDADCCGTQEIKIVVKDKNANESFFLAENSWWIDEESNIKNEFFLERKEILQFQYPKISREWLIL
jgi:hypothetical protein